MDNTHHIPLIDITQRIDSILLDLRYTTSNNIMGEVIDTNTRALVHPQLVEALVHAQMDFLHTGHTLLIWSAYRTMDVQKKLLTTQADEAFVSIDSHHCKGLAIDVTLADARTKSLLDMPTDFDDFTPQAAANATYGISDTAIQNRTYLIDTMSQHGFTINPAEWWHFDYLCLL